MTSKRALLRQQRRWANSVALEPDQRGYLATIDSNLRQSMSASTLADFQRGRGTELKEVSNRPAKMRALHSSAALVVNFFDYWVERDAEPLLRGLDIASSLVSPISFEQQFPTGLAGSPPNLDVALELQTGMAVGIESKFTEWLTPKRKNRAAFKDKYFENGSELWADNGLAHCQELALEMMNGLQHFRFLDAAQLLRHALGLATQCNDQFALHYLYYDLDCAASKVHREEVSCFSGRVGPELRFRATTYQNVYRDIQSREGVDPDYLAYLGSRYFSDFSSRRCASS